MTEEEKNEQPAVADTNVASNETATEESGAAQSDGLDELLKEFDERKASHIQPEPPKPSNEPTGDQTPIDVAALAALERRLNDQEAREHRRTLENIFENLADGAEADLVDAEGYLNARALRDPRINQAYREKDENPQRWNKVFGELKKDFVKRFGKRVDKQATESREAVASAVRSASTAAPPKDLSKQDIVEMAPADWQALQRKLGVTPV